MEWLLLGPLALLGALLALLLGVLLVLVCLPFHLHAEGAVGPSGAHARVDARWAWGVVRFDAGLGQGAALRVLGIRHALTPGGAEDDQDGPPDAKEPHRKPKARARRGPRWGWANRHALADMAGRLWRTLGLHVRVEGVVGLGDPADTAVLCGALSAIERLAARRRAALELAVQPDWLEEALDLRGRVWARLWLAHVLVVGAGFLLRPDNRRVLLGTPPP